MSGVKISGDKKMELKNKHVFWEALILAIFIFASGIFLGYLIELNRTSQIITIYQQSELDLLDAKIQNDILNIGNINCELAKQEAIDFANKVYENSQLLERYEGASKITEGMVLQHKKYDLLRTLLWSSSIKIKDKCDDNLNTIVYFYEYDPQVIETKSKQAVFSKKLLEVKNQLPENILLIPLAGNLDINSIDYLKKVYNVTVLPTILINENIRVENMDQLKYLENMFSN